MRDELLKAAAKFPLEKRKLMEEFGQAIIVMYGAKYEPQGMTPEECILAMEIALECGRLALFISAGAGQDAKGVH